jgi:hypothetical protein
VRRNSQQSKEFHAVETNSLKYVSSGRREAGAVLSIMVSLPSLAALSALQCELDHIYEVINVTARVTALPR